jgi:hypothetical protein
MRLFNWLHRAAAAAIVLAALLTIGAFPTLAASEGNIALGKPATASSVDRPGLEANLAVDGNTKTRWASAQGIDPQWISIDLGQTYDITGVKLNWENAYAKAYAIQVSNDDKTWNDISSTTTGVGHIEELNNLKGSGRYVRMYGTVRATKHGYSLWEFEVYGSPAAPPPPTVAPAASATVQPAAFAGKAVIAINCGGDKAAGAFIADKYYDGGQVANNNTGAVDVTGVANPAPQAVYQTERYGDFTYTIPNLTPGASYKVRLHFTEDYVTAKGDRVFNVSINDKDVLSNFDIYAEAGAQNKAVIKEFQAAANKDGKLVISFVSVTQSSKVDGIEVVQ